MNEQHQGAVNASLDEDQYIGDCSCGWAGPVRNNEAEAAEDVNRHYAEYKAMP
jgi:hypothetical protein